MNTTMNTLSAQFNTRLERIAFRYQPYMPRVAAGLAVICTVSVFLYGIFLLEAVAQAGARTAAERKIHAISSELSVLESQYLAATQSLTPDRAQAMGYVTPKAVTTVIDSGDQTALSFKNTQ